jgi:hypothetical protein
MLSYLDNASLHLPTGKPVFWRNFISIDFSFARQGKAAWKDRVRPETACSASSFDKEFLKILVV